MSYNKYNTRHSQGRYNTPGQFIPAGEQTTQMNTTNTATPPPPLPRTQLGQNQNLQNININNEDVEMKPLKVEEDSAKEQNNSDDNTTQKPFWMKNRFAGVKKISDKERRRRQNQKLRRLLTPKNALMALNEIVPNQECKVEPSTQFNPNQFYTKQQNFCADLFVDGNNYKGYGENKMTARNAAAEQAIRDLIIKKMNKVLSNTAAATAGNGAGAGAEVEVEEEEPLPMIQLASFALHKLFSEWEYEGHKVPQLRPTGGASKRDTGSPTEAEAAPAQPAPPPAAPRPRAPKPPKKLPLNASAMHPCMLLTYMRPQLEYQELDVAGDRPQNMLFTIGVEVDGVTYVGKACNKKEARKLAARSACQELFGVTFDTNPTANAPVPAV